MVLCEREDFFFNDTATTEIYTLSLHDALPIFGAGNQVVLSIKGENANMGFVALEKNCMVALWRNAINFAAIPGCDVEVAGFVEGEVPNIFCAGLEID